MSAVPGPGQHKARHEIGRHDDGDTVEEYPGKDPHTTGN